MVNVTCEQHVKLVVRQTVSEVRKS